MTGAGIDALAILQNAATLVPVCGFAIKLEAPAAHILHQCVVNEIVAGLHVKAMLSAIAAGPKYLHISPHVSVRFRVNTGE